MEDYYPSNRFYHTPKDTIETVDLTFTLRSVKLAVGTLAELAGIHTHGSKIQSDDFAKVDLRSNDIDWERDAHKERLFTLMPGSSRIDIIDLTFSHVHSKKSLFLEEIPAGRYAAPHYRSVCLCPKPDDTLVFVAMIRMVPRASDTEAGIVKIFDSLNFEEKQSFEVGKYPRHGCFGTDGQRFYLPYWGEAFFEVFDSISLRRISKIATPKPIAKLQVNDSEELAVGVSPETNSLLIFDLKTHSHVCFSGKISVPKDVVLLDERHALVCSQDESKIYQVDLVEKKITAIIADDFPSMRLIVSPDKKKIVAVHHMNSSISVFNIEQRANVRKLTKIKRLDLQEKIEDAVFGIDSDHLYLLSASRCRLFGLNLLTDQVFWAMRTGGVRPSAGFTQILYLHR